MDWERYCIFNLSFVYFSNAQNKAWIKNERPKEDFTPEKYFVRQQ